MCRGHKCKGDTSVLGTPVQGESMHRGYQCIGNRSVQGTQASGTECIGDPSENVQANTTGL